MHVVLRDFLLITLGLLLSESCMFAYRIPSPVRRLTRALFLFLVCVGTQVAVGTFRAVGLIIVRLRQHRMVESSDPPLRLILDIHVC